MNPADYQESRDRLARLSAALGVEDPAILRAIRKVPRHLFIPEAAGRGFDPYGDYPGPIGHGQTISQPSLVAYMIQLIRPRSGHRVLDVGTGSGYQAALLAETGAEVYGVEVIPELAVRAREILAALGYSGVSIRVGDGAEGWPEHAPYDGIIAGCAPERIPPELLRQLAEGGRMAIPVGCPEGRLVAVRRRGEDFEIAPDIGVRFVPMVGCWPDSPRIEPS